MKKADVKQGKVYVGKLPASGVGEDEIREYFAEFGSIAEVNKFFEVLNFNRF